MKKRCIAFAALTLFAVCLQAQAGTIVIKAAHTGNAKQKYHEAMEKFRDLVQERSQGRFKVDIYPSTLGGDRELIEALQIGLADVGEINTSVMATILPALGVFDLPYIFRDRLHAHRVLDGEIGDDLMKQIQNITSLVCLGYWENGFRCFTNNVRPIRKPEDLKDLKMRTMQNSIHLDTFALWGANPMPMSKSEMLTAMQQGVIDGHDNAPDTVVADSLWEVQRYFSESQHFYAAKMFCASPLFWGKLSPEDQKMFQEIYHEVRQFERDLAHAQAQAGLKTLAEKGMEVILFADMDIAAFQKSVKPIWDKYAPKVGADLIERISNHE